MDLSGKRVVVVGLGRSGVAAAKLCAKRGALVTGTDSAPLEELSSEARQLEHVVPGGHDGVQFDKADLVVVSPGVPPLAALDRAERDGIEVVGEVELAMRFTEVPVLAVGGTNGKSTTVLVAASILEASGHRVFVGGNLGTPLSEAVGTDAEVVVLEVSSFQLERAPSVRPVASVLLNISEDHLDRYADFQAYANAKGNAFENQTETDTAVIPSDDPVCLGQATRGRGRLVTFGPGGDYEVEGRVIVERQSSIRFDLEGADLHGAHNAKNAAAAIAAGRCVGATDDGIRRGLAAFRGLPHRTAFVRSLGGVSFYDDSKGTNVGASVTALLGLSETRGVLIAGGRDKHGSYEPLVAALEKKGRALVVLGEAADRIKSAVGDRIAVERAENMTDAVRRARRLARPGDAVLLSPACSSFDMYASYAERGKSFAAAVAALRDAAADEASR